MRELQNPLFSLVKSEIFINVNIYVFDCQVTMQLL